MCVPAPIVTTGRDLVDVKAFDACLQSGAAGVSVQGRGM